MRPPRAYPGGRFITKWPLEQIVAFAYKLPPGNLSSRLSGIPDTIGKSVYAIEAAGTMPTGLSARAGEDRIRTMVQTLLADRFKMAIHKETKEMPVYALVVAKGGPKLQKADIAEKDCPDESVEPQLRGPSTAAPHTCHSFNAGPGIGLHGRAVDMSDLVNLVENWTDRPFLDKTGIKGLYRVETKGWRPLQMMSEPPPGTKAEGGSDLADLPTLFQVFEGLGLKMEARSDKVEVYVVDHIERPSEN